MKNQQPEDFKRGVTFQADSESSLLQALAKIPGYQLQELPFDKRFSSDRERILIAPSGAELHLVHTPGTSIATTSNILGPNGSEGQDHIKQGIYFSDDEATKLADAAEQIIEIRVLRDISSDDIQRLRK